jgi:hypothetical protein
MKIKLGKWFCDLLNIKRRSFYLGDLYFLITTESPYFSSGNDSLNKLHFKFLGLYFVSRLNRKQTLNGYRKDTELIKIFESTCGVKVGAYKLKDSSENTYDDWTLPDAVVTVNGKQFVGTLGDCYWLLERAIVVCSTFPSAGYSTKDNMWVGWSHRATAGFKIGDRLFDQNYSPIESDYTPAEWSKFKVSYEKALAGASDDLERSWIETDGIGYTIPFKMRGAKLITNREEAKQAAINFSKYVS